MLFAYLVPGACIKQDLPAKTVFIITLIEIKTLLEGTLSPVTAWPDGTDVCIWQRR